MTKKFVRKKMQFYFTRNDFKSLDCIPTKTNIRRVNAISGVTKQRKKN